MLKDLKTMTTRRYDLDTLRIGAFALLIFYHIGMFYVSWGWHVKSVHAGEAAEPLMRLLNPWRLSLLFLISGAALRFAIDKTDGLGRFGWTRTKRLFLPLLFGMLVVVVPQAWLQLIESGEVSQGLIAFYPGYLTDAYSITTPTWNHLWYVAYILVYTLLLLPVARPLSRLSDTIEPALAKVLSGRWGWCLLLAIVFAPHMLIRLTLDARFPTTHDLTGDWANHAHSVTWLLTGYVIAKSSAVWAALRSGRWAFLTLSIGLGAVLTVAWNNWDAVAEAETWLWPARVGRVLYLTAVILTLLAWAQQLAAREWRGLRYLTEAVFPYYILHQTIIVTVGFWLTRQSLNVGVEFGLLTAATVGGCIIGHEIIRRVPILRPLFGLKPLQTSASRFESKSSNPSPQRQST
jgi:surface polysaccharide O-acyltransferase-like enzyme